MKCQQCSTDAPAETDPESGRLRCPQCHAFFGSGSTQTAAVRQARDILRKWSSADLLDQISSFPQVPPLADPPSAGSSPNSTPAAADSTADDSHTASPEADEDLDGSADNSQDTPAESEILSLPGSRAATTDSSDDSQSPPQPEEPAVESHEFRPLSILRPDDVTESSDSRSDPQPPSAAPQPANSGVTESSKEQKGRRLVRPPVTRRRPPTAERQSPVSDRTQETAQEGMEPVKKQLRVDQPTPTAHAPAGDLTTPVDTAETVDPRAQDASASRRFRVDDAENLQTLTDASGRIRSHSRPRQRYIDEAHESASLRGPHFQVTSPKRSSLTSLTGQFLAYIGVLGLTIGTAIVIYGHFGGMSEYTPTGWLVTTVAQMLLFLGIINLVSGGIEQNNDDVSRRINVLGEQLMRIEQVTESAMRGPRIPAERYAGKAAPEEVSERETAWVDER